MLIIIIRFWLPLYKKFNQNFDFAELSLRVALKHVECELKLKKNFRRIRGCIIIQKNLFCNSQPVPN